MFGSGRECGKGKKREGERTRKGNLFDGVRRRPQINYRTGLNIWPGGPQVLLSAIQRNVVY